MSVRYTRRAEQSLKEILRYIAQDDAKAALTTVETIIAAIEQTLAAHPKLGRIGRVGGTREWKAHKHYLVVYRIDREGEIDVLDVLHTSRFWPLSF